MIYAVAALNVSENFVTRLSKLREAGTLQVYQWHEGTYDSPPLHFVAYKGTTRELADELGFEETGGIDGVVLPVTTFGGYADGDLWEWLKLKGQKGDE